MSDYFKAQDLLLSYQAARHPQGCLKARYAVEASGCRYESDNIFKKQVR